MPQTNDNTVQSSPEPSDQSADSMALLLDLSAPQELYRDMIERGGFLAPGEGLAMVFDRATVDYVVRNPELFSSDIEMGLGNVRPLIPLNIDPPAHSKYRRILDPLFAPKQMDVHEEDIKRRVNGFIDGFVASGGCNFTEEFAELLPSSVFLGLMGLPEEELPMFLRLRDGILHPENLDPNAALDPEARRAVQQATGKEVYEYFAGVIDQRRRAPVGDVISGFLTAEVGGQRLSDDDILDILYLFLIAGLDTVSDTLTCMYAFLATHEDHRRRVATDPSCIPRAVEELLRWESPVPFGIPRMATAACSLPNGEDVSAGTAVMVMYGAANVDPGVVDKAGRVDFDREANRHIAFGGGVHRCLGSHLARRELRITLAEWHRRIPDYRLAPGHEELTYVAGLRSVKDLTLSWA